MSSKIAEFVFPARPRHPEPPLNVGIQRVISVKILAVILDPRLTLTENASTMITLCYVHCMQCVHLSSMDFSNGKS